MLVLTTTSIVAYLSIIRTVVTVPRDWINYTISTRQSVVI